MVSSSDARRPDRKIEWSSTMSTLVMVCLQVQVNLGADPARAGPHGCGAACAGHPPDDRFSHPEPVGGEGVEVDAGTAVANEDVDGGCRTLDVHGDLTPGVPCGVQHGLAGG